MQQTFSLNSFPLPGPIQPVNSQALVKLAKADESTKGGLFLATENAEKPREGVVVAVGEGRVHPDTGVIMPVGVKVGDLVLLSGDVGEQVEYCGSAHQFIADESILGVFEGGVSGSPESFRPLRDLLLIKLAESATSTSSGIAIAVGDNDAAPQGEVIAVGPGRQTSMGGVAPMDVSKGDNVMFQSFAGSDVTLVGGKYKVVSASDCIAKW